MGDEIHRIKVGSRKSELALIQTRHIISRLKNLHPKIEFEIVTMSTMGDKILDIALPKIGEKSLFTKELETALENGSVDFLVHSLKDLPTSLPPCMAIGAVLKREDPRDALVLHKDHDNLLLETLPAGSVIGTSSLRRTAQLAKKHPHLKVENIRGNLNTRLKKLDELGTYQGIILAAAGLIRMEWTSRITKFLETDELLYAVGQGALAVECRKSDVKILEILKPLYDVSTALRIVAERSFLKTLDGGCSAPVAVASQLTTATAKKRNKEDQQRNTARGIHYHSLQLCGAVWSLDGKEEITDTMECRIEIKETIEKCHVCVCNNNNTIKNSDDIGKRTNREEGGGDAPPSTGDIQKSAGDRKPCDYDEVISNRNQDNDHDNVAKKPKIIPSGSSVSDIPVELLKNDPHEHCPVDLPVGVDFMGKCPYLESDLGETSSKNALSDVLLEEAGKKCPYIAKNNSLQTVSSDVLDNENNVKDFTDNVDDPFLYCGLVANDNVYCDALRCAHNLGESLAKVLIKKGATEVMTKAKSIVHNSIGATAARAE